MILCLVFPVIIVLQEQSLTTDHVKLEVIAHPLQSRSSVPQEAIVRAELFNHRNAQRAPIVPKGARQTLAALLFVHPSTSHI